MTSLAEMLRQEEYGKIWDRYCGFLQLNLKDFMHIQERLLMEQIELLSNCELGQKLMGEGAKPETVEEFRQRVPLTTYEDYADILLNKNEEALPAKPVHWIKTEWNGGSHDIKLAPYTEGMIEEHTRAFITSLIFATNKKRSDLSLRENDRFLYAMDSLPYLAGLAPYGLKKEINFEYMPSIGDVEHMSLIERHKAGFELAVGKGVELFFGLSSVLVMVGEDFEKNNIKNRNLHIRPINIRVLDKLFKAFVKRYIKRQTILPKDVWDMKGILCADTDTHIFRDKIEYYWGKRPIEIYWGAETSMLATEIWDYSGLTFFPDINFLEFIPEKDSIRSIQDKSYTPKTVLIDEIKPNERYELVTTKFRGGAFVRYRVGDIIECISTNNEANGIELPQIRFADKISDVIDLTGFTRITKAKIEEAILEAKFPVHDWIACKQYVDAEPILHIYMEVRDRGADVRILKCLLNESLQKLDSDYKAIQTIDGRNPLKVTLLPMGTFDKYRKLSNNKLSKMNPLKQNIDALIKCR